jgi:hypothetical protein
MVAIDYLVGVPSPKLHVPEKFEVRIKACDSLLVGNIKLL